MIISVLLLFCIGILLGILLVILFKKIVFSMEKFAQVRLSDVHRKLDTTRSIPNIVYQVWVNRNVPEKLARSIQQFRDHNPNFSFILYDDEQRDQYMLQRWGDHKIYPIFKKLVFQPAKADIFRYCLLFDKGGFYFDIKSGLKTSIDSVVPKQSKGILSYEINDIPEEELIHLNKKNYLHYPNKICLQWGLGFCAGHPILQAMIDTIVQRYPEFQNKVFANPKMAILKFTGPILLTHIIHSYASKVPEEQFREYILELGIDFNGHGIYAMNGAELRFKQSASYADTKDSKIVE